MKIEKQCAYLDQNILDFIIKNIESDDDFFSLLRDDLQVVYSDTTLEEIYLAEKNGGDSKYSKQFLDLLVELNAFHCSLMFKNQQITNQIYISFLSPFEHYSQLVEDYVAFEKYIRPFQKQNLGIYGGIGDFQDNALEQKAGLSQLISWLEEQVSESTLLAHDDKSIDIESYLEQLKDLKKQQTQFKEQVDFCTEKNIEHFSNQAGHQAFREHLSINIDNLKKIKGEGALIKIYELIKEKNPDLPTLECFFQLETNFIDDRELYIFEKVKAIYTMLNLIGYYPDEKLNKENKMLRSLRDLLHSSYACFFEYFFTNDNRQIQKTLVAYNYLGIMTQVLSLQKNQ